MGLVSPKLLAPGYLQWALGTPREQAAMSRAVADTGLLVLQLVPVEGCGMLPFLFGNGWEWGNGIIVNVYSWSFPHSLLSTSKSIISNRSENQPNSIRHGDFQKRCEITREN